MVPFPTQELRERSRGKITHLRGHHCCVITGGPVSKLLEAYHACGVGVRHRSARQVKTLFAFFVLLVPSVCISPVSVQNLCVYLRLEYSSS